MQFLNTVRMPGEPLNILIAPWGEVLTHRRWRILMAQIALLKNVRAVSCQTNLSFDIDHFLDCTKEVQDKIRLWCSFHPSQTSLSDFVNRCRKLLDGGIQLCAGAVAVPENIDMIRELRRSLPDNVYVWVNANERSGALTPEQIREFGEIDPLFSLETREIPADFTRCAGGRDSLFVEADGSARACVLSKQVLGSIFDGRLPRLRKNARAACRSPFCSCYLAYCNRTDLPGLEIFGGCRAHRIIDSLP